MFGRHSTFNRRDAILLLIGATTLHLWNLIFPVYIVQPLQHVGDVVNVKPVEFLTTTEVVTERTTETRTETLERTTTAFVAPTQLSKPASDAIPPDDALPQTQVLAHAPGWTLFRNLYMTNGTLVVVADEETKSKLPPIRMMISYSMDAQNTPENIAAREPDEYVMDVISPLDAAQRWTSQTSGKDGKTLSRIWTIEGKTMLVWDPRQFLRHYYHFVAELFFGFQAFWHGVWSKSISHTSLTESGHFFSLNHPSPPPIDRIIFAFSNADGWRDGPGFNQYFLRGVFPSVTVEHEEDWLDRVQVTRSWGDSPEKAFRFPLVALVDRSAANRGVICGSQYQRTAAEAWDYMRRQGRLMGIHVGGWWAPIRENMWLFAGAREGIKNLASARRQEPNQATLPLLDDGIPPLDLTSPSDILKVIDGSPESQKHLKMPEKIVISYISRQSAHSRRLIKEDHEGLVTAAQDLVKRKNEERKKIVDALGPHKADRPWSTETQNRLPPEWEFQELVAEYMTHDEQIREAARTTILLGLHGNGLTHLVFMEPNRLSTVIEIFWPGGFAHDYYWTSRALGMSHIAVWNDTYRAYPNKPHVDYPEGFQGIAIPVYGPNVAQVIEDRVAEKL